MDDGRGRCPHTNTNRTKSRQRRDNGALGAFMLGSLDSWQMTHLT